MLEEPVRIDTGLMEGVGELIEGFEEDFIDLKGLETVPVGTEMWEREGSGWCRGRRGGRL